MDMIDLSDIPTLRWTYRHLVRLGPYKLNKVARHMATCGDCGHCDNLKMCMDHLNMCNRYLRCCIICKKVAEFLLYHARHCQLMPCHIPRCAIYKMYDAFVKERRLRRRRRKKARQ